MYLCWNPNSKGTQIGRPVGTENILSPAAEASVDSCLPVVLFFQRLALERAPEKSGTTEEFDRSVWGFTSIASAVWLFKRENVRAAHLDGLLFPFGPQTDNP